MLKDYAVLGVVPEVILDIVLDLQDDLTCPIPRKKRCRCARKMAIGRSVYIYDGFCRQTCPPTQIHPSLLKYSPLGLVLHVILDVVL